MGYAIHSRTNLQDRVESSWQSDSHHRDAREKIVRAYLGNSHGLSETSGRPLNGHALYVRALIQYMAAHAPRVLLTTDVGPWKQHLEALEYQVSRTMKIERFGFKQQRWVIDALMYAPGVFKVIQEWKSSRVDGEDTFALQTSVSNVDRHDWFHDGNGTSVWDCDFTGDWCHIAIDDVVDNPMFRKVDADKLRGLGGSGGMKDRGRLFFERNTSQEQYREHGVFAFTYDQCRNRIKVWPRYAPQMILYDEPWEGHPGGPFHYIDFLDVPNQVVGLSPLCIVHDLIEATNRALAKSIAQMNRAKQILRTSNPNTAETESLLNSFDGAALFSDGGGNTELLQMGGPSRETLAMVPILQGLFNWMGGNINELAGLGVSAPTATQGQLLAQQASGMVNFMQARTHEAVRGAVEAMVWAEISDRVKTEMVPSALANGKTYWTRFTAEQRNQLEAILIQTDIDVYSMRYRSPDERLQDLMAWWTGVALPAAPIWQAQGGEYDLSALNRTWAKYKDLPEINEIAIYPMQPQSQSQGGAAMPMRQSPVTSRTNVRMDRGGGGQQELGGELAESLLGSRAA